MSDRRRRGRWALVAFASLAVASLLQGIGSVPASAAGSSAAAAQDQVFPRFPGAQLSQIRLKINTGVCLTGTTTAGRRVVQSSRCPNIPSYSWGFTWEGDPMVVDGLPVVRLEDYDRGTCLTSRRGRAHHGTSIVEGACSTSRRWVFIDKGVVPGGSAFQLRLVGSADSCLVMSRFAGTAALVGSCRLRQDNTVLVY